MSLAARISSGLKATFAARIIDIGANGILMVVLARYLLTPDQYGLLYIAISVVGVASMFGTLGLPSAVAKYVTEYNEKDAAQVPQILRISLGYLLALSIVTAVVLMIASSPLASVIHNETLAPLLVVGGIYVLFEAVHKYLIHIFQAFNRVSISAVVTSTNALGRLVFAIALTLVGLGTTGALMGYVVGFGLSVVVGGWILYTKFYRSLPSAETIEDGLVRRMLEYSVPLTATRGATVIDKKVDTILVGALANPAAAGFYTIAKQVSDAAISVASSLGFTISPAFGDDKAGDRLDRAAKLYEKSLEHILLLYIPGAVGLILVAEPFVQQLFGSEYLGAVPVIQVISIYILVNAVTRITSDGLDFLGRARDRAIIKTTMAITNFFLNLLLIPFYGAVGAAAATAFTHSIYATGNVYIMSRELPVEFGQIARSAAGVTVISGGMGAVVYYLLPYISGLGSLAAVIFCGAAIWAVLSTASGLLDVKRIVTFLS